MVRDDLAMDVGIARPGGRRGKSAGWDASRLWGAKRPNINR